MARTKRTDWDGHGHRLGKARSGEVREWSGHEMLERVRQSLQARLEGRDEGGDIEVMRLVDEIVEKEVKERNERWRWKDASHYPQEGGR